MTVEGSEFDLPGDTLIPAIGQIANLDWLSPDDGIEFNRRGAIKVDAGTMLTSRPGVFAAGDAVSGPLTVVHGLAGGKRAAHAIHQYVTTGNCSVPEWQWMADLIANIEKDHVCWSLHALPAEKAERWSGESLTPTKESRISLKWIPDSPRGVPLSRPADASGAFI